MAQNNLLVINRRLKIISCAAVFFLLFTVVSIPAFAEIRPVVQDQEPEINYLFRNAHYLSPGAKLKFNTYESDGFFFLREKHLDWNSDYSIIGGFDGSVLETWILKDILTMDQAKQWVKKNAATTKFLDVSIKTLPLLRKDGSTETRYWVGQRSFPSLELAQASIVSAKTSIETSGGNFDRALRLVEEYAPAKASEKIPSQEEMIAQFQREEKYAISVMDYLHIGERLYGPLHTPTSPWGEKLLWQSFGETSFRTTNLEHDEYNSQVGYWTNRFVMKGLRGPFDTTFDPYAEITPTLESNGVDFKSNMKLIGGIEWYPLIRNAALQNFQPGGIPILNFARNYRFFVQYLIRENLKEEITGSKDNDLWAGVDIFYEYGLKLPPLGVTPVRTKFIHYVQDYVWGEYYGTYHWEQNDFSSIKNYSSWILNSSVVFGVKWPSIPLPPNPVNDELTFMPYVRFEHVTNPNRTLFYQNYYLASAGVRLMPFRSYQFSDNEWLFNTKLFVEYVGIGGVARPTANTPVDTSIRDLRFGVNVSYKRF